MQVWSGRAAFFGGAAVVLWLTGCGTEVHCRLGDARYAGRPPRDLFAYDTQCRGDCFDRSAGDCVENCAPVELGAPEGELMGGRTLRIFDVESLAAEADGSPRALVYSFGFVDEAGGGAPTVWSFHGAGKRSYLTDRVDGAARFAMEVAVHEVSRDDAGHLQLGAAVAGPMFKFFLDEVRKRPALARRYL